MSNKPKAKKHSFFSNMFFIFKTITKWDKTVVPISLLMSPFLILTDLIVAYFVTTLTWCIENQKGIGSIVLAALGLAAFSVVTGVIPNRLNEKTSIKKAEINRRFDLLLGEKIMDMDFEIAEGPTGRDKYQKAKNSLGYEGVYGFVNNFSAMFTNIIGIFTFGTITASLNPWLILILTGAQLLAMVSTAVESWLINKTKDPMAAVDRKLNYITKTSRDFAIAKDIRLFHLREYLQQMSEYFIGERKFWTNKMYFYYFLSDTLRLLLNVGIEIGIFAYIAYEALNGEMSKTALVLYAVSVTDFTHWVEYIGEVLSEIIPSNMLINDLREFLDISNSMENKNGRILPAETPYKIEIENLSFTYPETDKVILDNINLTINAGERLALVGVNGAGKTTLVKLLSGLYRPTSGSIKVNGTDISEINRDEYYKSVSAVFQEARIMPCAILENVSMLPAEESDIEKFNFCIRQSGLYEKIQKLPEKENTLLVKNVNENAVELSGGEIQRLLLARAIYKDAPTLILDEPTAALDPIAENEIYLKYSEISKDKTSIYISHRLSSTRFCDRIVLLDNASIAEEGTHEELMALSGKYAEMFRIQSKYYEKEAEENEEI